MGIGRGYESKVSPIISRLRLVFKLNKIQGLILVRGKSITTLMLVGSLEISKRKVISLENVLVRK